MFPAVGFVILTAVLYVLHSVVLKYSSGRVDPYTGIFMWSLGAFLVGLAALFYGRMTAQNDFSVSGLSLSLGAGAAIATGSLGYFLAYQRHVDFSFATPFVNISVVMGGLIFGLLLFGEVLSVARIVGVVLGAFSIALLVRG